MGVSIGSKNLRAGPEGSKTAILRIGGVDGKKKGVKTELELRHLRVFVTVVEVGAHIRAARALGISQSTVSETLSALERTLGTALFRKAAKGAMLTPSGEALLPYARRILALTSELVGELANVSTHVSATLVVAAVESLSAYVLPARLAVLRQRWPKVRLEVITGVCSEIRESVAAGKSELGLVLEAESGVEDDSILAKARLVIFGSPTHPLVRRRPSPDELRRCDFYMSDAAGNYHQVLRQHFEAAQVPLPRTQALGTVEGVKRGILTGGTALGLLPAHAVEQELRAGLLAEVIVDPALPGLVLRAVTSPGNSTSPVVDDLLQSLRGLALGG
jgi:DNA-binding transcriptional LysR family regulator